MAPRRSDRGFILPLAVLLVLFLSISGMSFLQLDSLERKMTLTNVDNHGAFYVASAGIERAREVLKIPTGSLNWTSVLQSPAWNGAPLAPGVYRTQQPADPLLCPFGAARGCVVLPPGSPVGSPDNLVFGGTFDDGQYAVRAYNNESTTTDSDQILTVRALGLVRNEKKVLEVNLLAVSGVDLLNCEEGHNCPEKNNAKLPEPCVLPWCDPAAGREPDPTGGPLPSLSAALTSSQNYYRQPGNFGFLNLTNQFSCGSGVSCGSNNITVNVQNNSFYFIDKATATVTLQGTGTKSNVVIFTTGNVSVKNGTNLSNAILVGVKDVTFQGGTTLAAPLPPFAATTYPAVIAGGNISGGNQNTTIYGTLFTGASGGDINLGPSANVHGVVIGDAVKVQGTGSVLYTDDHNTDPNYLKKYYGFMPGFDYPPELKTTAVTTGSWQEIQ